MDLLYSSHTASQDLRWGDPASGTLGDALVLGFYGYHITVTSGHRYVYVTGNKNIDAVPHAWLVAVDTCSNTIVKEIDFGPGFAGQVAMYVGSAAQAYVAVSQSVGQTNSGGVNRIEIIDVTDPANPTRLMPPAEVSGSPYGTFWIVWSSVNNTLYTAHRGSGDIISYTPGGTPTTIITLPQQPTGLALNVAQDILFVARRGAGDLVPIGIRGQPGTVPPYQLPDAISSSALHVVVDSEDRILVTSKRPNDGFLFVIDQMTGQIQSIDTQGTELGQPVVTADATAAFVPRGGQNDIAEIDLTTLAPPSSFITVGNNPTDVAIVSHQAGMILQATPSSISTACDGIPVDVVVTSHDACGQEITNIPVRSHTYDQLLFVVPPVTQQTPATFQVYCASGGSGTITFETENIVPPTQTGLSVTCQCPVNYCLELLPANFISFSNTPGAIDNLLGIFDIFVASPGNVGGPAFLSSGLLLRANSLRFVMTGGQVLSDLRVRYERYDSQTPQEIIRVPDPAGGAPLSFMEGPTSAGPLAEGVTHEVVVGLQGISEFTVISHGETVLTEICFRAIAGLL